jgi:hypothetical protein
MSKEPLYQTWASDAEKQKVCDVTNLDGYDGTVFKSAAHGYRGDPYGGSNQQTYIDIEPNKSVRPSFNRSDYDSFRPGESIPNRQKKIMSACMASYDRVGIIRNVIDLMSDFASQGLVLVHPNKTIEKFYRKWFTQVKGYDRSERFLNYLYRCGNVAVQRRTAKLNRKKEAELKRAAGADVLIDDLKVPKREVPWMYDFLNPVSIDVADAGSLAVGKPQFYLNISKHTQQSLMNTATTNKAVFSTLPKDLQSQIQKGERRIPLGDNTFFYHYKKDDWLLWANPMIYAILDDIRMLEKMKLADLAALDGAISQVRLWTVGDYEHKIVPTRAGLQKIRDILASNVGGGTMDLVWGPELKFTESNSQVYKFLGDAKYQPVLTSIYAGLGIPPTLTGASGSSGGYTNNFVSLKTLVERLEYGREVLSGFWKQEIEYVRRAMGFRLPAEIHFDSIILSDESAQKKLLMDLADRDIISQETLLERFKELPNIEKVRVGREERERSNNPNTPRKAGPYHNPHHSEDVAKLGMQQDYLDTEEYFEKLGLPYSEPKELEVKDSNTVTQNQKPEKEVKNAGRPTQSKDTKPRKQRRVLPRSGEPTSAILWGIEAQEKISEMMTPVICEHYSKKDSRSLSKAQVEELEYLKLSIFASLEPMVEVNHESIQGALARNAKPSSKFVELSEGKATTFNTIRQRKPNTSEMRHIYASTFAHIFCNWAE